MHSFVWRGVEPRDYWTMPFMVHAPASKGL